jgi:hypothetical protein
LYTAEYKKEFLRQEQRAVREQARKDVTMARKTKAQLVRENAEVVDRGSRRFYKNVGGSLSVRKDALSRLKRIGR